MELKNGKLYLNEKELALVKKYNWMASPYTAGLFLYHALKREGEEYTWNVTFFRDVFLTYRKKNFEVI